ncbi:DUF6282 family protein [Dactylosporangium sp. NPDC000555]|uniref:DUF6282 family protein n=1 Tax=Dactylosporangium sp. NPDC000555 TaxID=3154260 RepID=UPI003332A550
MSVDLNGAVDLHVHFGPDRQVKRSVTAVEAVRQAQAAGHAGIVLKSHDQPTTGLAAALDELFDIRVVGAVTCDVPNGGLNPHAVRAALELGAGIVWLPTTSGTVDWPTIGRRLGVPEPGIAVCDDHDVLVGPAREILDLCVAHGAVVATGHISLREHIAVAAAMRGRGPVLATHVLESKAGPGRDMTDAFVTEFTGLGGLIEVCAHTLLGDDPVGSPERIAEIISLAGPEKCVLASDLGQFHNPPPVLGLQLAADRLVELGFSEKDVRRMAVDIPASLLAGAGRATRPGG